MLRIATFNINGIRAARRRGFDTWLRDRDCDVVALQEVRCPVEALPAGSFPGYHVAYDPGVLAGRGGVAVLSRERPIEVRTWSGRGLVHGPLTGPGDRTDGRAGEEPEDLLAVVDVAAPEVFSRELRPFAREGRYVEVDLPGLTVASLYLPKGGLPAHLQVPGRMREAPDGGARYQRKMRFLAGFARQVDRSRTAALRSGREFLLMGDLNIAHAELDVANWRRSHRTEGFLPEERAWLGERIGPRRLVDVVRRLHPEVAGPYSWWSWLGQAFEKDAGWRIDLHLATPRLARTAMAGGTDRPATREERMSDHAPVVVDYAFGHWA